MYKLTIIDYNNPAFVTLPAYFFIEDGELDRFGEFWLSHPGVDNSYKDDFRAARGDISHKASIHGSPYHPLEYDEAEVLEERSFVLEDREFSLLNACNWESEYYAGKANLDFRLVKFKGEYYILGKYKLIGICGLDHLRQGYYRQIMAYGNPVLRRELKSISEWEEMEGRPKFYRTKEDFAEDVLETACWITLKKGDAKTDLYPFDEETLLAEKTIRCLMQDIPGEGG